MTNAQLNRLVKNLDKRLKEVAATCKGKVFIVFQELYNGHDIYRTTKRVFAIEAAAQHYVEVMSELNTNVDVEYCLEEWEIE